MVRRAVPFTPHANLLTTFSFPFMRSFALIHTHPINGREEPWAT